MGERSLADSQAALGNATTRVLERLLAASGSLVGANVEFTSADDVPQAGALFALPVLLAEGLLRHTRSFYELSPGFYPLESIFLYLALLALVRCRSLEQTRYESPGEWGKMLGLDRLPEVKTLRAKVAQLCAQDGRAAQWQSCLAKEWIEGASDPDNPKEAGAKGLFYVDGHVRLYHGDLTALPRRYVTRQRLCLRGTTDYWVNGLGGEPFFVVTEVVNTGLIAALREHVIPELLDATVNTTTTLPRATVVFDREGYSPEFFAELKAQNVAMLTYHKFPGEAWPEAEFGHHSVRLHSGELVTRELAERGTLLPNKLWVREVRVLGTGGHQTSILTTHPQMDLPVVASRMAARWCQENFFKYMRENFGLDRIIEHGIAELPDSTIVINPARRRLEADLRRRRVAVQRRQTQLGALGLSATPRSCLVLMSGANRMQVIPSSLSSAPIRKTTSTWPRRWPRTWLPR